MLILFAVILAALVDRAIGMTAGIQFEAVAGATCLWFIASEGFSIIENMALMGVPIPNILFTIFLLFISTIPFPLVRSYL